MYEAVFNGRELIDQDLYVFSVYSRHQSMSCPLPSEILNYDTQLTGAILQNGQYVSNALVQAGDCRGLRAVLFDTAAGVIISEVSAYVDNTGS